QLTYQELKSLVVQYPYCQNLRYLMLKKCQLEGHRDFDRNLKLAATYLPDRTHLFRKMKEFAPEVEATTGPPIEVADDFLELRSLFELESDPQPEWLPIEPEEENPASEEAAIPKPPSEADLLDDLPFTEIDLGFVRPPVAADKDPGVQGSKDPTESFALPDELLADIAAIAGSIPLPKDPGIQGSKDPAKADTRPLKAKRKKSKPARSTSRPQPKPKSSFSSWLQQFQSPQVNLQLDYLMEASRQTGATTPGQTPEAERMAQESIQEHEEIATETLAFLLDKQGHTEKAIAMYERLCEMHPEKTERFQKKIQEIRDRQ
ncbi:MAG: tetratricopeptide repeat protein, partial [Saprospiraceae bacterium]|nr:tetratricopeptide repeat protein [Saprospiraceae bacterium]